MKTLVTGGKGFIGHHMVEFLQGLGHEVSIIDRVENPLHSYGNRSIMSRKLVGIERVYNFAAFVNVLESNQFPASYMKNNVESFANLLELWKGPLFHASSCCVEKPLSVYALTKCINEEMLKDRHDTTVARFYNVFGEGDYKSVIYTFIKQALQGLPLTIYGDGHQTRSFVYVKDLCHVVYDLLEAHPDDDLGGIHEIGGYTIPIINVAEIVIKLCESSSEIVYKPARLGEIYHSSPDLSGAHHQDFDAGSERQSFVDNVKRTIVGITKDIHRLSHKPSVV